MKKLIDKITKSKLGKKIILLLKENKKIVLSLIVVAIFVDSFFIQLSSDFVFFGILFLYGFLAKICQIKSRRTFLLCLFLLTAMFISFLFTGTSVPTEKAAVWLYLFMALGIFQQWKESY